MKPKFGIGFKGYKVVQVAASGSLFFVLGFFFKLTTIPANGIVF